MFQNKIKILIFSLFFVLFVLCFISSTKADPTVMVTDYTLEPETLLPGDSAELTITLTNTETTATKVDTDYINSLPIDQTTDTIAATINNVWITSDGDGTYAISAHENYEDIGDLSPGSSITLSFEITAHENISSGLYNPIVRVDVINHQDVQFPIPVRISSFSATILPKDVPKKISSSGSTTITLTAVNNREATVEDVTVTADANQSIAVSPSSTYIGTLESESSHDITCSLHPSNLGKQNITFTISFRNGENTHTNSINIPVEVIETHDVSPVLYNMPSAIPQHGSERITLEIYNAKSDTITGVTVIPVTEFSTSPSEYFIGSMDADDVFSASFDVYTDELEPSNYSIGFKVAFKQGNNYFESPTISEQVSVFPNNTSTESIDDGFATGVISLIVLIIVIVFFILWKRRIIT
jgi:hypothetical protein